MGMMQTGGQATAGGAALARAVQRQGDIKRLEEAQRAEAKRQKKGGLFGSIGGIAGGLLGAALAPVTGGASLALVSGLGTALGRGVGERLGAGKSRSVDRTGTVFGQQSFRDVEEASRDFTRGIGERALVSGLKAAATAGLAPGGGIYGKVAGKLRPQDVISVSQTALPTASQAALEAGQKMGAEGAGLVFGRGDAYSGLRLTAPPQLSPVSATGTDLSQVAFFDPATDAISKKLDIGTVIPENIPGAEMLGDQALDSSFNQLDDFSSMVMQPTEDAYQASLANAISLGEKNSLLDAARTAQQAEATAREASRSAGSLIGYLRRQDLGPLADFSIRRDSGSFTNPLLTDAVSPYFNLPMSPRRSPSVDVGPLSVYGSPTFGMQDGGLLGMQTGGFTAESILESEGLDPTSAQLKLFQAFDPTGLQSTADTLRQQQVSAGQQSMQQQAGSGFAGAGGVEQTQSAISKAGQRAFDTAVSQEQARFASQTLGTAADLVAGGAEFSNIINPTTFDNIENVDLSTYQGDTIIVDGVTMVWTPFLPPLTGGIYQPQD
jgi:hypothetical protein